jgi:hypothetical protein
MTFTRVCQRIVWSVHPKYAPEKAELSTPRSDIAVTTLVPAKH